MDESTAKMLIDFGLCVVFAALFAVCHAFSNNQINRLVGWDLFRLIALSVVMGSISGLIIVPASEVIHAFVPSPDVTDRSVRLCMAAVFGWIGLDKVMGWIEKYIEAYTREKFKGSQGDALAYSTSPPDSAVGGTGPDGTPQS